MKNKPIKVISIDFFTGEYVYVDVETKNDLDFVKPKAYNIGLARQKEFKLIQIEKSLLDSLAKSAYNCYIKSRNS